MEKKYTVLRIIATLYKIVAVIILVLTVLSVVFTVIAQPRIDFGFGLPSGPLVLAFLIVMAVFELLIGGMIFLGVFALGDLIYILINIEENTRFTALLMRDRLQASQPMAQPQMVQPMQPAMQVPLPPPPPYQQP
jgi:hypothetical protein